jgi:hypothetical protein
MIRSLFHSFLWRSIWIAYPISDLFAVLTIAFVLITNFIPILIDYISLKITTHFIFSSTFHLDHRQICKVSCRLKKKKSHIKWIDLLKDGYFTADFFSSSNPSFQKNYPFKRSIYFQESSITSHNYNSTTSWFSKTRDTFFRCKIVNTSPIAYCDASFLSANLIKILGSLYLYIFIFSCGGGG